MEQLILADIDPRMVAAWKKQEIFARDPMVKIVCASFTDMKDYDCVVSPGNSFALMDGGVDYNLLNFFGWSLMTRTQKMILDCWSGEQPVGTSLLVPTENKEHPWLAHTPTMRIPPSNISTTNNAYLAMWGMLNATHQHNLSSSGGEEKKKTVIKSVLCFGLGTGVGRMSVDNAAQQMALAWKRYRQNCAAKSTCQDNVEEEKNHEGDFGRDGKSKFYLISWDSVLKNQRELHKAIAPL